MEKDKVIEVLECMNLQSNLHLSPIQTETLIIAREILKRINSDKIRGVMGINCESYPADEYKMADAIVNYLEEKL